MPPCSAASRRREEKTEQRISAEPVIKLDNPLGWARMRALTGCAQSRPLRYAERHPNANGSSGFKVTKGVRCRRS
jgi:hypothetical protein